MNPYQMYQMQPQWQYPWYTNDSTSWQRHWGQQGGQYPSHGQHDQYERNIVNLRQLALQNNDFRKVVWTGKYNQTTVMSIPVGRDIGEERHPSTDQLLYIEQGQGYVRLGDRRNQPTTERYVSVGDAIFVPAGKWHNVINTGRQPLKLFSQYAPPEHH